MGTKKICVIGAGAAGLVAIRHIQDDPLLEGCVFEQTSSVGGVWNFSQKTGNDEYGLPIHSTAYKGLRTNLPSQVMEYLDYPFHKCKSSFLSHEEILQYLKNYVDSFNLTHLIQFTTRVISVKPHWETPATEEPGWKVITENLKTKTQTDHHFDSVLVCNGHYTVPFTPDIANLENFQGEIVHSRDYRVPEVFQGKRVLIVGGAASAIDISLEIVQFASQVTVSCRSMTYNLPKSISIRTPIVAAQPTSFITYSGEEVHCEVLLLCTGYLFDFPFLSSDCGITVEKGKYITPLYRHLINANYPSMAFIGIPLQVSPFPLFDCQVRYFLKVLKGDLQLPNKEAMMSEIYEEEESKNSTPIHQYHKFADLQWSYKKLLAQEGEFSGLIKPFVEKLYKKVGSRRQEDPINYKYDQVTLIDDENYDYSLAAN